MQKNAWQNLIPWSWKRVYIEKKIGFGNLGETKLCRTFKLPSPPEFPRNKGKIPQFIKMVKNTYKKLTANIRLNSEKLETFLLISGTRQMRTFLPLIFNIIMLILANAIRQGIEVKL